MFRDELLAKKIEYYNKNKDKINEKCLCECNKYYTHTITEHAISEVRGTLILYPLIVMKGRSIAVKNLKEILEATYEKEPKNKIDDYELDTELSNEEVKFYHKNNTAVVAFRGTTADTALFDNLFYVRGKYEYTPRFQRAIMEDNGNPK